MRVSTRNSRASSTSRSPSSSPKRSSITRKRFILPDSHREYNETGEIRSWSVSLSNPKNKATFGKKYLWSVMVIDPAGVEYSSLKSYSDCKLLRRELARSFPGAYIPPLPDKTAYCAFGRTKSDSECLVLSKFIQRCTQQTNIGRSEVFLTFLRRDGAQWEKAAKKEFATRSVVQLCRQYRDAFPNRELPEFDPEKDIARSEGVEDRLGAAKAFLKDHQGALKKLLHNMQQADTKLKAASKALASAASESEEIKDNQGRRVDLLTTPVGAGVVNKHPDSFNRVGLSAALMGCEGEPGLLGADTHLTMLIQGVQEELADCRSMEGSLAQIDDLRRAAKKAESKVNSQKGKVNPKVSIEALQLEAASAFDFEWVAKCNAVVYEVPDFIQKKVAAYNRMALDWVNTVRGPESIITRTLKLEAGGSPPQTSYDEAEEEEDIDDIPVEVAGTEVE
ncbi:hypothetical protein FOL47_010638 [Perkinsus chesapeaki]|uniref:PX domain-containing protein n=1 Tax=Perkinsus chesapeaki TaxID=330153 RepID=A0A7J6MP95_PERCH|nr:hypothetical protein FOL47_010638 [Perkinsus chesapeaki]